MINTTTRSLLKIPSIDLNSKAQHEIDMTKLAIWRANMVLRKLEKRR